jgi:hypothetical protein
VVAEAARLTVAVAGCAYALSIAQPLADRYIVVGQCRAGVANGGYELRMPDGRLRVGGAFAQGHMTGTFIFWTAGGARVAVIPFDNDAKNGTVALWYVAPDAQLEAGRKLESPYIDDRPHGLTRSWHPNGAPRAEYRYEHGILIEARGWNIAGAPLSDAEAHDLQIRDAEADDGFYATLLAIVHENLPPCD